MVLSMTNSSLRASCVLIPALINTSTNGIAEPSITGGSFSVNSMRILSIWSPKTADKICSTVWMRKLSTPIVVPREMSITWSISATISGQFSKSRRLNRMPEFSGAGLKVAIDSTPVWSPIPLILMSFFMVVCLGCCLFDINRIILSNGEWFF